jgi:hypothetical protein
MRGARLKQRSAPIKMHEFLVETIMVLSIGSSEFVVIGTQLLTNNRAARLFPEEIRRFPDRPTNDSRDSCTAR